MIVLILHKRIQGAVDRIVPSRFHLNRRNGEPIVVINQVINVNKKDNTKDTGPGRRAEIATGMPWGILKSFLQEEWGGGFPRSAGPAARATLHELPGLDARRMTPYPGSTSIHPHTPTTMGAASQAVVHNK